MHPDIDVILRDGKIIRIRPITHDDKKLLEEFFYRLSPRTRYMRFQYTKTFVSDAELERFVTISPPATFAYVGTMRNEKGERIVAVGRWYQTTDPAHAEVSFVIEDGIQVKGLGTALLENLADTAMTYRIDTFLAAVLFENAKMLEVFTESGFKVDKKLDEGVFYLSIHLDQKEPYITKSAYREHVARSAGVRTLLYPKHVAVIGASNRHNSIGGAVFRNILNSDFAGIVFPVNPTTPSIGGVYSYPSILDVPVDIDLAVVVVPAAGVPDVIAQCGKKGVKAMVIISAGFGEAGPEGKALQDKVSDLVTGYGIRLVGPNCLGVLNFDPAVRLNATFSPLAPPPGRLSIATQSGALGLALIDYAKGLGLGIAQFVSIGNRIDISSVDLLEFWEDDENTDVILLYEESFGSPRKFARTARRVSRKKPIIAVKAGRSEVGARAASSHTGALAASDATVDAMFRQAGVIRAGTIEEMFNVARGLYGQPVPQGNRIGILTNAGGPGVLAADACEGWGLKVPALSPETQQALRAFLPHTAAVANPVDLIASAKPQDYEQALRLVLDDSNIDAVIVIYIPPLVTVPDDISTALKGVLTSYIGPKPVMASFMVLRHAVSDIDLPAPSGRRVPMFSFPEDAVQALARAYQYHLHKTLPEGIIPEFSDIDPDAIRKEIFAGREFPAKPQWLMPEQSLKLLRAYGIATPETVVAMTASEAASGATAMGYPVALKLRSATITHKTDAKGIALGLEGQQQVVEAYEEMQRRLLDIGQSDQMQGVLVQRMAPPEGTELILGMVSDPLFGPIIMVGLGGIHVELLKDVSFSIHPLRDVDPQRMLERLNGLPLLKGWRGKSPSDMGAIEEVLLRFSALVDDFPEIEQVEINPLVVYGQGQGCLALDARIRVRSLHGD